MARINKKRSWQKLRHGFDKAKSIDDLTTDEQVLFGFLTLVVDIMYRDRYGKAFDAPPDTVYNIDEQAQGLDQ